MHQWSRCVGGRGSRPGAGGTLAPELTLKLHQAPHHSAVDADVGLDVDGQRMGGGQVDAE
jgi:hypothetical protein